VAIEVGLGFKVSRFQSAKRERWLAGGTIIETLKLRTPLCCLLAEGAEEAIEQTEHLV
jgi:hypothetical protein